MVDIDQAFACAFARRGTEGGSSIAPSPHLMRRKAGKTGVSPQFVVGTGEPGQAAFVRLEWSLTINVLECQHGDRFENLANLIMEARDRQRLKVLLFTSCHRAEGRTTLILTLARALARRSRQTLLVDGDLTSPMLARQLGIRTEYGLDDVVEHEIALADALIEAPEDNLSVLPLRAPVVRPHVFLASPNWSCVLARIRRDFDLILLDSGPLFAGLNSTILHRAVDAAILVHNRALTGPDDLLRAREILEAGGIPLLGLAETFL